MATYYNYISVRDQLLLACKKSKCTFNFGLPKNIKGLHIDDQWTAKCSDRCNPRYCEAHVFIFIPDIIIPQTIYLIYTKENPTIAYVYFNPEILDILQKKKILESVKLQIEKNASKVLPSTLH